MARFSDIPNELLREILSLTSPDDIESVVLVDKRIYDLSGAIIKYHNDLKRRSSIYVNQISEESLSLTKFLCIILEKEELQPYVKDFTISTWCSKDYNLLEACTEEEMEYLISAIERMCPNQSGIQSQLVLWGVGGGNEDAIVAKLLFFLSYLRTISSSPEKTKKPI